MRISFDLDDTLFVSEKQCQTEPPPRFPLRLIYRERLRSGTIALIKSLREMGAEIWIYTTSFRSERYIRNVFRCYGIRLDGVVNGARHAREVQSHRTEPMPSKYPSHYRICLHVDDDPSVAQNGQIYGFVVTLISPDDLHWTKTILSAFCQLQKNL